ncbi:transglycosylase domain-containing protein [Stakelama saccharophila]|uniref:peptidoglycan glycosyltransferase n=1 Tax=Stakelama saccharophila TaxID=3075605 RepID=A0ABZ0BBB2_9SPHN|nr:PBP1A family penicillin-binding protein [Stakelama sp. W311]WNO54340.1 PBP1A family penicillin-binding protein [Stakelama sp. W311]
MNRFDPLDPAASGALSGADRPTGAQPWYEGDPDPNAPPSRARRRWRWFVRGLAAILVLFVVLIGWLALTAPLSKSLEPPVPPSVTLLSAEGTPIARRGAIIAAPVDAAALPDRVTQPFIAIEDRRFYGHWGIDPIGITRALVHNIFTDGATEGGSTITQQLAKNAFLSSKQTLGRKAREALIALWLEAWLSKDEILSRYLSNIYFGDNVYGLRAAADHYFSRTPEKLTAAQAAMLAGLVKAPSRLDPTDNLDGARDRQAVVVGAMVDAGFLTLSEADAIKPARLKVRKTRAIPNGTYFADWILPAARDAAGDLTAEQEVRTTLETKMQKAAERAVGRAGLDKAQVALVAMRPDGRVVAMVGGRDYGESPFNRATQARRQPGSTFKLFVYLAALRDGMTPDSMVDDAPVTIGDWSPENAGGHYRGPIPLTRAFAVSSNVAAARLTQKVGPEAVIRAARDLGITTPIPNEASIALGTSSVSLLELTSAFAAIAAGEAPVEPRGLAIAEQPSWFEKLSSRQHALGRRELAGMRRFLAASVDYGTSHQAALAIPAYGKTGTTQDSRDAWFLGYAGGLVAGVWVGNDDNTPNPGLAGGGLPARIWRDFMTRALGVGARPKPQPAVEEEPAADPLDLGNELFGEDVPIQLNGNIGGLGLDLRIDPDGGVRFDARQRPEPPAAPPPPAPRNREPEPAGP